MVTKLKNLRLFPFVTIATLVAACGTDELPTSVQSPTPEHVADPPLLVTTTSALITNNCGDNRGIDQTAAWPMRGGCPTHAAQVAAHGTAVNSLNWKTDLGAPITSSPAVASDGTIYVGTGNGKLYALRPDGTFRWPAPVNIGGILGLAVQSSPTIGADGTVYVGGETSLHAIAPNGVIRWSYPTLGCGKASPVIGGDGTIYFGTTDSFLHALRPDGTQKWFHTTLSPIEAPPAIGPDGTVYVASGDNVVNALRPDGTTKWSRRLSLLGSIKSAPAVVGDRVYVTSENNALYALATASGSVIWQRSLDNILSGIGISSSPALGPDGTVYFGGRNNRVVAYSPTGSLLWSFETQGDVVSSPIVDMDGNVFVGSDDNHLYALSGKTGALIWKYQTGNDVQSSPAMDDNGTVYVGSSDGFLYSIGRGTPAGSCGVDYPCVVTKIVGSDTQIRGAQPNVNLEGGTRLTVGFDTQENRALVGFSTAALLGDVSKDAELVSAKLVLTRPVAGGAGTGTLAAHVMSRPWLPMGATWTCANDTDLGVQTVNCAASDVWSMSNAAQLPYAASATTAPVSFSASTDIEMDVTADVQAAIDLDKDELSWLLRLSSGSGRLQLGSAESGAGARVVLSYRPDTKATKRRDDRLAAIAAGIADPLREGHEFWLSWASVCDLYRASRGEASSKVAKELVSDMTASDRDEIRQMMEDIRSIPSATAQTLLGPLAGFDPRACTQQPQFEQVSVKVQALDSSLEGHLRANFCTGSDDSITVNAEVVQEPSFGELAQLGLTVPTASPVLIGIDPTPHMLDASNSLSQAQAAADLGHPALIDDWIQRRGGRPSTPVLENPRYPGDGLSPFGVETTTDCSASSYQTDNCDHGGGLICGSLVGRSNKCYAFPVIPLNEGLRVIGHNFWDRSAFLVLENVSDPSASVVLDQPNARARASANAAINCTPAINPDREPSLEAISLGNQNTLQYDLTQGGGFYRVKVYNKNGNFRTQADARSGRTEGRVIHVCRSVEADVAAWEDTSTMGTIRDCTPPTQTCVQDGAACTAQWGTAPRSQEECNNDARAPGDGLSDACGETPSYFESRGRQAIVYIAPSRPTFTHRAFVNRIECTEETLCNNCGGEDEIAMVAVTMTGDRIKGISEDPKRFRDEAISVYRNDFEHRQIRHPEYRFDTVRGIRRSSELYITIGFVEEDQETVTRTQIIGGIVTAAGAAVTEYYAPGYGAAVAAAGATATKAIISKTKGADNLGYQTWHGTYWDLMKRVDFTHRPDFMLTPNSDGATMTVPPTVGGSGKYIGTLLHPIIGYGRSLPDTTVECGTPDGQPSCSANTTCYVNQCIGTEERDGARPWLRWPNGFSNPTQDDATYNVGWRMRYDTERDGGHYKADYTFALCRDDIPEAQRSAICREVLPK
jgi:outer membrane protein assembly factor BamB